MEWDGWYDTNTEITSELDYAMCAVESGFNDLGAETRFLKGTTEVVWSKGLKTSCFRGLFCECILLYM